MSYKRIFVLFFLLFFHFSTEAQIPVKSLSSSEIELSLKKLNVVGSVLYVAAHPDDENTSLLTYFANEQLLKTSYLSLTRGDGGQNLIGKEIREQLGVIRTQELLAARRLDGADQYFTRANDFGYSKNPEETLKIWDKEKVLSDVVWTIRKTRPDIILTRFPKTGEGGHGHHTSSAILAEEAFYAAADPKKFPEQLKWVQPWKAKGIYWNAWQVEKGIPIDIGTYNPLLGKSYSEIAADSRSMHKSQGFGVPHSRGTKFDYATLTAGEKTEKSLFENIDLTWKRVKGADEVSLVLEDALKKFDHSNPSATIPSLVKAYKALQKIRDEFWKREKSEEIKKLILACAGIYYETTASGYQVTHGSAIDFSTFVVNRSSYPVQLKKVELNWEKKDTLVNKVLANNQPAVIAFKATVPSSIEYSQPYWLKESFSEGLYTVNDQTLVGTPENKAPLSTSVSLEIAGVLFKLESPIMYKWTDPVFGEKYRSVTVLPAVTASLSDKVYVFSGNHSKDVLVTLTSETGTINGDLVLMAPTGWKIEPSSLPFDFKEKNEQKNFTFKVTATDKAGNGSIKAAIKVGDRTFSKSKVVIDYDHIPVQTLLPEAASKIIKADLEIAGKTIGYIEGAGDEIAPILTQMGYTVHPINNQQLTSSDELEKFDAIIVGIRAYNTNEKLKAAQHTLMKYVSDGGNLIVQYNVSNKLVTEELGPYPIAISRDRVTVEQSPVKLINEGHSLLNFPNKISEKDFEGWVQERGLYFPSKWDERYKTVISTSDPGEKQLESGILVADVGKGSYIYTSYSWFRQLPEGVPGAIRLFANMVSYRREMKSETINRANSNKNR